MDRFFVIGGAIIMFMSVGAGAFGAHGLSDYFLRHPGLESTYDTAVRYQAIHGLAMFVVAYLESKWPGSLTNWSGYLFIIGIFVFSGSLYLLVFTRISWLGAITPIGGLAFLGGWFILAIVAWRQ